MLNIFANSSKSSIVFFLLISFLVLSADVQSQENKQKKAVLEYFTEDKFTGDLNELKKRKRIRALVVYSKTDFFFSENGTPLGLQVELLREYEKHLNKGIKKAANKIRIKYVPTTFDRLIPDLQEGRGDIIAAFLTITPQREQWVDFISGRKLKVQEVVISNNKFSQNKANTLNILEDLSGKETYVLRGSSYVEHLKELNKTFSKRKLKPVKIREADALLTSEEILQLVNSGVVNLTVVDDYKAKLWSQVLENINVHEDIAIKQDTYVGWAVRKNNPDLKNSLNDFLKLVKKGTKLGNMLFARYFKKTKWIQNPNSKKERGAFNQFISLFKKYGDQYGFDSLALAAQGYQESKLNQNLSSHRGAIGIMQLLPSTAADKNVGIPDISDPENNIHAGVKYLAFLRDRYFSDSTISSIDQMAFSWAAYNAGPAKVQKMRKLAKEMGLDNNRWFSQVEVAAGKMVGRETVEYVSNIFKYYIAYTLAKEIGKEKI